MKTEEIISNEFINRLGEWVALHDQELHFAGRDLTRPDIKLCGNTLRVRANQAFKTLPKDEQECMVAHEIGHREYQHYLKYTYIKRMLQALGGVEPTQEIEADRYASKLVGKNRYIAFLKKQKNETPIDGSYSHQLREYELRIQALENLK